LYPTSKKWNDYFISRGYSSKDVKDMELGLFIKNDYPSWVSIEDRTEDPYDQFREELKDRNCSQTEIEDLISILKKDYRIGRTNIITIPYRSGGVIKGFKFRKLDYFLFEDDFDESERKEIDAAPKYLNNVGLDKVGCFFNISGLTGDKDLVIVEGELDALHATVKGLDNVVALGGNSVSSEQVRDAIKKGAKKFTICLDREPDKEEETAKAIDRAIEVILAEGVNKVYIVTLPDLGGGKTDPDRLIKERGVEAFKQSISEAISCYQ
ncbi:MAG: hypothetical protein HOP37_10005, partial [Cyclobacteriaceae bacterium]|nr:hypothetical protein [Cyclobacteriaceae bacterium]